MDNKTTVLSLTFELQVNHRRRSKLFKKNIWELHNTEGEKRKSSRIIFFFFLTSSIEWADNLFIFTKNTCNLTEIEVANQGWSGTLQLHDQSQLTIIAPHSTKFFPECVEACLQIRCPDTCMKNCNCKQQYTGSLKLKYHTRNYSKHYI